MDIRLYTYDDGVLRKVGGRYSSPMGKHKHHEIREAKAEADKIRSKWKYKPLQFLIVEYTGSYESRILELY